MTRTAPLKSQMSITTGLCLWARSRDKVEYPPDVLQRATARGQTKDVFDGPAGAADGGVAAVYHEGVA